jgi:septin family protein
VKYVLISGYVAILFGRSRSSEDIDIFIEQLPKERFTQLWDTLMNTGFSCINAGTAEEAYDDYLTEKLSIRFAQGDEIIPNMEVCFPKRPDHEDVLKKPLRVELNEYTLFISPIESQIAYKISMNTPKDIEDARYLYKIFEEHLNRGLLELWLRKFQIGSELRRYLQ